MKARDQIKNTLAAVSYLKVGKKKIVQVVKLLYQVGDLPASGSVIASPEVTSRLQHLEQENKELKKVTDDLRALVLSLESRVKSLESPKVAVEAAKPSAPQPPAKAPANDDDDDDDVDLFGSDDEDEEAERIKQERVAAYAAKKSKSTQFLIILFICNLLESKIIFLQNLS